MSDDRGLGPDRASASEGRAERLGRYVLRERIGRGGMAEVFLAQRTDDTTERLFVVKRVLPHLAVEQKFVSMFLREGRIVARIQHENVVQVLELDQDQGAYFLAMEYLDGLSLQELARRAWQEGRALPLELVVRAISDAALGLHSAHELRDNDGLLVGLVHRDISPDNLFLTCDGVCKVLDFGIARDTSEAVLTATGELKGKVPFLAPEQVEEDDVDRRADIFALGVTLFWLLTGTRPFKGKNDHHTMLAIVREEPPTASSLNPHVPPQLDAAIAKMLAKKRELRPQTGADVYELLEPFRGTVAQAPDRIAFIRAMKNVPKPATSSSISMPAHGAAAPFATLDFSSLRPDSFDIDVTTDASLRVDPSETLEDAAMPSLSDPPPATGSIAAPVTAATSTLLVSREGRIRTRTWAAVAASAVVFFVLLVGVAVVREPNLPRPGLTTSTSTAGPTTMPAPLPASLSASLSEAPQAPATGPMPTAAATAATATTPATATSAATATIPVASSDAGVAGAADATEMAARSHNETSAEQQSDPTPVLAPSSSQKAASPLAKVKDRVVFAKAPAHVAWQRADGKEVGRGNTEMKMARDERLFAFDTRRLMRTEVMIVDGTADYARLATGELSLRVAPYADMVWLGKEELGPTPFAKPVLVVAAGTYRARLRLKDREKTMTIVVPPRGRVEVRVNMADP